MRFWDHLAQLPAAAQLALVTQLTLGCSRLVLAVRLHQTDAPTVVVLGTLATAHTSLTAARALLDPHYGAGDMPDGRPALGEALPRHWRALVEATDASVLQAWLAIAIENARDAGQAALDDAEVDVVRDRLADALRALGTVRDTAATASR